MSDKRCLKCGLPLPEDHKSSYCGSSKRHACWINDSLNQWRQDQGHQTKEALIESFYGSIESHIQIAAGEVVRL